MAILRSVTKTDNLETQRQIINLVAQDVFNATSGTATNVALRTEYADGTLLAPVITFVSDTQLGIYKEGSQKLGIVGAGKPIASFTPSGSYFAQTLYSEKRSLSTANLSLTSGGAGYLDGNYTNIDITGGSGSAAKASLTVASGSVTSVTITEGGVGYLVGNTVSVDPADISASPTGTLVALTSVGAGQTYVTGNAVSTLGGAGIGLTVDITASANGVATSIGNLNALEGYVTANNVSTTQSGGGTGLTVDIVADSLGKIGTIDNIIGGSNYFAGGGIIPTGGAGTGAVITTTVVDTGAITGVTLTASGGITGGSGYITDNGVSVSGGGGSNASVNIIATPIDSVASVSLLTGGSVYTTGSYTNQAVDNFNVSDTGTGLQLNYTVNASGVVSAINGIAFAGTNYVIGNIVSIPGSNAVDEDPESETFGEPLPDNATVEIITVTAGGVVTSVTLDAPGLGYLQGDILTINGGIDSAAVSVDSILGGSIDSVSVTNPGQNYVVGNVLTVPGGTGGTFTVVTTTGGIITSATLNNPGSGYLLNSSVTIDGGQGSTVVVTGISGGAITNITVNNPGGGYKIGDIITIGGVNNPPDKATFSVSDTSDGAGLSLLATDIAVTTPISLNVLNGEVTALNFVGNFATFVDVVTDTIAASVSATLTEVITPKISAVNNLLVDVVNDITVNAATINIADGGSTQLSITPANGNLSTSGVVKALGGINVNEITTIIDGKIETLLGTPMVLKPSTGTITKIESNRALVLPSGTQSQRPQLDAETGAIRFNTDTKQFEGYDGSTSNWSSLGNVRDTDGNTYLLAEATVGANDNTFYFFNNAANTLRLSTSDLTFDAVSSIKSISGNINVSNSTVSFNQNLTVGPNLLETKLSGLTIKPASGNNVVVDAVTSIVVPSGLTSERGVAQTGAVRFNTSNHQFEGYGLGNWSSLGGVRDVDGNTYIIPELGAGTNENILYFYNNSTNSLQLHQDKVEFRSASTLSSINIVGVTQWVTGTLYQIDDLVYNGINVYKVTAIITSTGIPGPLHTSGTTNNYQWIRTIYGDLTVTNVNNFNINSVVNINNKLKFTDTNISSVTDDITITPFIGKIVKVDSTTSFVLPVGDNLNRGIAEAGAVRFNTATTQFEGYSGTNWTSLGGVRDVDGNTYIIPESSSGANENILYFYNDGDNTLRVTKTALTFQTANTITSNNNILNIDVDAVKFDSDAFAIDNTSATITKLYSTRTNLDIGLKTGIVNDALLRLAGNGDISVNTTFAQGSFTPTTVFNSALTYFGLTNSVFETTEFTLVKGTNDFNSYVLYNPTLASACKVTVVCVNLVTNHKHMVDYNVICQGTDIYNIEYEGLFSSNVLYDASFDFNSSGNARITLTLDSSVTDTNGVKFIISKTVIK